MSVTAILDEVQKLNDEEKADLVVGMVSKMSVGNLGVLVKQIEKKFEVSATAGTGQAIPIPQQQTPTPVVVEKTEFTVVLKGVADTTKKLSLIKEVRAVAGLDLVNAKALVESAPKTIKANMPKADAEAAKAKLEAAGGAVELT
jgi:large subunit ribosomal protein L7/L12